VGFNSAFKGLNYLEDGTSEYFRNASEFNVVNLPCRGTLMVAQLVEALRYKPEGRGFDSRWCYWTITLT
jgi:hypothetical protein